MLSHAFVGVPTAQREPRQNRKVATVAKSECGTPFLSLFVRRRDVPSPWDEARGRVSNEEDDQSTRIWVRRIRLAVFFGTALIAAAVAKVVLTYAPLGGGITLGVLLLVGLGLRLRSKLRIARMLRRGDVNEVIAAWSERAGTLPHGETLEPLVTATAFAAYGRVEEARRALRSAVRGPAWDAALEHRLFLDVMLSTFEGDEEGAFASSQQLAALPIPETSRLRSRVTALRESAAALARAFVHRSRAGDLELLERAAESSPLVYWAMRYGAAIVAIDQRQLDKARALIERAPSWPEESTFRSFHQEIEAQLSEPTGR